MVNAEKHRALLSDYETRVSKRLNKMLCLSNNSRKRDKSEDDFIIANIGKSGIHEIKRTQSKRNELVRGILNEY